MPKDEPDNRDRTLRMWLSHQLAALWKRRLTRFLVVGFGNTIFGYLVFALLYLLSGSHRFAIIAATIIGVCFNFFTTGRIVFANSTWRPLIGFVLGYGVVLAVNIALVDGLLRVSISPLVAQAIALPVVVALSYLINSRLVFPASKQSVVSQRAPDERARAPDTA